MEKFKVGDQVKVLHSRDIWLDEYDLPHDTVLKVIEADPNCDDMVNAKNLTIEIEALEDWADDFVVVSRIKEEVTALMTADEALTNRQSAELGVYRPNLEDRKVGKVRVELVDDGFPLALREVAKVMTWAQTAKGYKDHDWQNLPNPEQALAAAASRHRSDYIIQRMVEQLAPTECVDIESAIIHKAHEAFGVLAQLELILRGKIK